MLIQEWLLLFEHSANLLRYKFYLWARSIMYGVWGYFNVSLTNLRLISLVKQQQVNGKQVWYHISLSCPYMFWCYILITY